MISLNLSNVTFINQSVSPGLLERPCFCIYPEYGAFFIINVALAVAYLINNMFRPFERETFKNKTVDTESLNIYIFIFLLTVNLYYFCVHILFEPIAYSLGYM